ncbi:putative ribonuclease H-like domain-containing protein [Tanacetum coccineum]
MAYSLTSSNSSINSEVSNDSNCCSSCLECVKTLKEQNEQLVKDLRTARISVVSYKTGLESVEARLLVFKKNDSVYEEDIKLLKREICLRDLDITELKKKLELVTKEKENSSKCLSKLLESQIMDKCKTGLGYNAVPPPYTGSFMPPKPDLVYLSLDDFVEVNESVSEYVVEKPSVETNEPKNARKENRAPIIKDWVFESEKEDVPKIKIVEMFNKPSFAKINFVKSTKQVKSPRNTSVDKNRQNTPSPRGNKRNWNQQMSQKLGNDFEMFNKACHVNTVKGARVNTARPKAVLSAVKGKKENAVKASACWVWRPKHKVLYHVSRNNGASMSFKRFDYINAQGRSKYMIGNKSYLTDYEEIGGGFVAFGDVYFVKELKFKLFSVSQMCDKKNNVLFTDTACVVLSPDFKLTDQSHVLLKVPRKDNMYTVDLKNVVPQGGLTCLFEKATSDESNLRYKGLRHVNFKTINKLVRGNLVRGLPSKLFKINQTCVACQKGKHHRASCKTKTVSSISQPLQMLHMDLFGPTFVKSLMKKMYCLVVTDDFIRFSWVFFLATKDETSEILKTFITDIENLIDLRVKVRRCDNGTEFKNRVMNQLCEMKGIKREFSVARTLQQNRAEAINTACYVQNRVLVIKPHNKNPYEIFLGRKPALSFMRPFGCLVIILNTIDHLGKFDGKDDEGFFIGYSTNSKVFKVFNSRTIIVEENLHVQFSKNIPNIEESRPNWLFDIDALTKSMSYKPVVAGNQSNRSAYIKACDNAGKARVEKPGKDYILLPLWSQDLPFSSSSKDSPDAEFKPSWEEEKKDAEDLGNEDKVNVVDENIVYSCADDPNMPGLEDIVYSDGDEDFGAEADINNLNAFMPVSPIPTTRIHKDHPVEQIIKDLNSAPQTRRMTKNLKEHSLFSSVQQRTNHKDFQNLSVWTLMDLPNGKRAIGTKWVYRNKKDKRGFEDPDFPDRVYKVEKALYGLHQSPRACDILLVQVYMDDIIFGSTKKSLCIEFEKIMHKKFQMSYMGELTFFLRLQVKQKEDGIFISQDKYVTEILKKFGFTGVKTASTPMETHKPLLKDADVKI